MKKVKVLIIGAGNRGNLYASYSKYFPKEMEVVGVAEPDEVRRKIFAESYHLKPENIFQTWQEALEADQFADVAIICTQDTSHLEPFLAAEKAGYHILLEKPMATSVKDCKKIAAISAKSDKIMAVCHVLRYTPYFNKLKEIVDSGVLGEIISINHLEAIGHKHFAHSYVRGNWRKSKESGPLTLTKACHDFDIINWIIGKKCSEIFSYGELTHFKKENAPHGSAKRCLDCKVAASCPYEAKKVYLDKNNIGWPTPVITNNLSRKGIVEALETGPYGRCVYHCDNDVVDHQNTVLKYDNGITASLTISAFTEGNIVGQRFTRIMGSLGELIGDFNSYKLINFRNSKITQNTIKIEGFDKHGRHGGGDYGLIRNFLQAVNGQTKISKIKDELDSHLQAFAAEDSRKSGIPIRLN